MRFTLSKRIKHSETRSVIKDHVSRIQAEHDLTGSDISQLNRMATAYEMYLECSDVIFEQGATMENLKGETVKRPEVNIQKEAWAQYLELLKEYGLTKKSRKQMQGLADDMDKQKSPLETLVESE